MSDGDAAFIRLPEILDLDNLDSLRDGLNQAIGAGPVRIDAASVERVATNSLFALLAAAESARGNNFQFHIDQPSPPMLSAIARLGLEPHFSALIGKSR